MSIPVTPPSASKQSNVTIGTVTLPLPEQGDTQTFQKTRISRESRGLTRLMLSDSSWYCMDTFELQFVNLTEAKKLELQTYWEAQQAAVIIYTDYLRFDHNVVITGMSFEERKDDLCSFSCAITLVEVS